VVALSFKVSQKEPVKVLASIPSTPLLAATVKRRNTGVKAADSFFFP